jgi:thymidylate synthase ThyX
MKVTLVSIKPTKAADDAGRPALTPELLAATGARYSRSNEGLETILSKIDQSNPDKSVDSIFRMVDYGHQSIADMAQVSIFIDNISIWLAYYLWTLSPTAGGQESSTRYIELTKEAITPATELGIPTELHTEWQKHNLELFKAYDRALALWQDLAAREPALAKIPRDLLNDSDERSKKTVARMLRNYAFDRARYFLPVGCRTNVMLVTAARNWTSLIQHLSSHPLLEANTLGSLLANELSLSAPRMLKHATPIQSIQNGIRDEFNELQQTALQNPSRHLDPIGLCYEHPVNPYLDVMPPPGIDPCSFAKDLQHHDNRYAWIGPQLKRIAVRFGWEAVTIAEVRDLNRHRTGNKYCPLLPVGFYAAKDQIPDRFGSARRELQNIASTGHRASVRALNKLHSGDPTYIYYMALGTQVPYEQLTTANHYAYTAELRTGLGSHYRYAQHMKDSLALWYQKFPCTKGLILEGTAEPE